MRSIIKYHQQRKVSKMNKDILKSMYRYDEENKQYLLELSLNDFDELFNEWDASPIRKKDLDPELVDYLIEAMNEIPSRENIGISFKLNQKVKDKNLEDVSRGVFKRYFEFQIYLNKKKIMRQYRKVITYLILGFAFIVTAYQLNTDNLNITFEVVSEGLFIGGWVFIWESISLLFFSIRGIKRLNRKYKRILDSMIRFRYKH
jgi:hypothetical protein